LRGSWPTPIWRLAAAIALFIAFVGPTKAGFRANFYPAVWFPDIPGYLQILVPALACLLAYAAERWFVAYSFRRQSGGLAAANKNRWQILIARFIIAIVGGLLAGWITSFIFDWSEKFIGSEVTIWSVFVGATVGFSIALILLTPIIERFTHPFWSRFGFVGATIPTAHAAGESIGRFLQQNASRRGWGSVSVPASETPTDGGGVSR
jgi:fructose-specific phosphotransferase system IIC component